MSKNDADRELVYNDELTAKQWALNSAVECHPHTVEVVGSNPTAPTIFTYVSGRSAAQPLTSCCRFLSAKSQPDAKVIESPPK